MPLARPRSLAAVALAAAALAACTDSTDPPRPVVSIDWQKPAATLAIADSARLEARALDISGQPLRNRVAYASSDTMVVAVSAAGVLRARDYGDAWVRVSAGGVADSVRVRVHWDEPAATELLAGRAYGAVATSTQLWPACGLAEDGRVFCSGQAFPNADPAPGATRLRSISGGQDQLCGLAADGSAHCIGYNGRGEFGLGAQVLSRSDSLHPAAPGRSWWRLEAGDHAAVCGLQAADSVAYCWGHNDQLQTGRLPVAQRLTDPAPFTTPLKLKDIELDVEAGCGIALDDALWCWGWSTYFREPPQALVEPVQVAPAGSYVDVAIARFVTCGLGSDGIAWCWGDGTAGATAAEKYTPRRVQTRARFTRIFAGFESAPCGLTAEGALHCWSVVGGDELFRARPRIPDSRFSAVRMGATRLALTTEGRIFQF